MKQFLILIFLSISCCSISFAKIWRVNNNPGILANFTTAQAANDNASVLDGDTIHLEPSNTSYGNLTCTKRLTWVSIGNFLSIHLNEEFSPNAGRIDVLTADAPGCANSVFHINAGIAKVNASGVRIDRCFLTGLTQIGYTGIPINIVVINSYIKNALQVYYGGNIIISNNIIENALYVGPDCTSAVITQNVINANFAEPNTIINSIVENNIFNQANAAYTFTNCSVQYNMSGAPGVLPTGNNNQNGIPMNTVFVNYNGTDDASFVLKAGSPAIGAGSGSPTVDLGAFGGSSPFKLALQPGIPAIYKIGTQVAPLGTNYNVTFSTRSNN